MKVLLCYCAICLQQMDVLTRPLWLPVTTLRYDIAHGSTVPTRGAPPDVLAALVPTNTQPQQV